MKSWLNKRIEYIRNLKYRKKMNLVLLLVGIFPLAVVSIFMILSFLDILVEKEYEAMRVALNQTASTIEKQVDIYNNLLNYTVFDNDLQEILEQEQTHDYQSYDNYVNVVDPILNTPKFYHEGIQRMTIYSENITISHDVTLAPLTEISAKNWFDKLENTGEVVWVWSDMGSEELLAVREFPGYQEKKSYLGMYCSLDGFVEPLYYFQKKGAGILLTDESDRIIYVEAADKEGKSINSISDLNDEFQYLKCEISSLPLRVYIYMDKSEIYSRFKQVMFQVTLVIFLCLVFVFSISRYISRFLVKRIEHLTTCVNQVDYENMEIDVVDHSQDEIGVLIRSFRKMLGEIKKLISEVYQSRIIQQNLEMKALQAQINPHFLYNTLSVINWKAISAGEDEISKVTLALSDYYRTTLNKGESIISIRGELTNIQSYLEIQLVMHDYEFQVEYQVDPFLETYQMPKLILQPLVENAINHGLDVKEEGEKKLLIACRDEGDEILWVVEDNGVGMDETNINNLVKTQTTGYGVKNVNDRLVVLYGERYGLQITSKLGVGTKVEVRIPKNSPNKIGE